MYDSGPVGQYDAGSEWIAPGGAYPDTGGGSIGLLATHPEDSNGEDGYTSGGGMSGGPPARSFGAMMGSGHALPEGNVAVGFAITAGVFVLGGWALRRFAGSEESAVKHLSPSLYNAMITGAMGVLTIPLWRALFAQGAAWNVPFMVEVSSYVNGA